MKMFKDDNSERDESRGYRIVSIPPEYYVKNDDIKSIVPGLKQIEDVALAQGFGKSFSKLDDQAYNYVSGAIPLLYGSKSESLINQLLEERSKLKNQRILDRKQMDSNSTGDADSGAVSNGSVAEQNTKPVSHFVALKDFTDKIKNRLDEQILSLSICKFPNYSRASTEEFLQFVIVDLLIPAFRKSTASARSYNIDYHWTCSNYDNAETKLVYVKFELLPAKGNGKINDGFVDLSKDGESKLDFVKNLFCKFVNVLDDLPLQYVYKDEFNRTRTNEAVLRVSVEKNTETLMKLAVGEVSLEGLIGNDEKISKKSEDISQKSDNNEENADIDEKTDDNNDISTKINNDEENAENQNIIENVSDKSQSNDKIQNELDLLKAKIVNFSKALNKNDPIENENDYDTNSTGDYKVNLKELADLPKNMVPQIVEDIKNFRLGIIRLEKKKQAKKLAEEKRRAKLQIKQMYMSIKESRKKNRNGTEEMDVDVEEDEEDEEEFDETKELSDSEYENIREDEEQEKVEKEFLKKEARMKHTEQSTKDNLYKKLLLLQEYEKNIENNQQKLLEEYDHVFGDPLVGDPLVDGLAIEKLLISYESDKPAYLQSRNAEKLAEIRHDNEDRQAERKIKEAETEGINFLSSVLKSSVDADHTASVKFSIKPNSTNKSKPDLYSLEDSVLTSAVDSLVPFINELLEEYLGVTEEDLVSFITNAIKSRKPEHEIFDELKETFDDDTETFMKRLITRLKESI